MSTPSFEVRAEEAGVVVRLPIPLGVRMSRELKLSREHPPRANATRTTFQNGGEWHVELDVMLTRTPWSPEYPDETARRLASLQDVLPGVGRPPVVTLFMGEVAYTGLLQKFRQSAVAFNAQGRPARVDVKLSLVSYDARPVPR